MLQGDEFITEPRSLYWKAQVARALFDHQFLLPQAPAAPDFFLIPERDAVTVVWRPSISEQTGDPYYDLANGARIVNAQGASVVNVLYDPNYRQFDVEGYRIYRGRVDDPVALELVAQFDYSGTTMSDYGGYVNAAQSCAPELQVTSGCLTTYDPRVPGVAQAAHRDEPIVGPFIQTRLGDRIVLSNSQVAVLRADTVGAHLGYLADTGVPFNWRDTTVRQGFRYFYTVTAFDVNSLHPGPASQESPRVLKPVRPESRATNLVTGGAITGRRLLGRGIVLDTAPTTTLRLPRIEPSTGRFAGPFRPRPHGI